MDNTNQGFEMNEPPGILSIKPVEELEAPVQVPVEKSYESEAVSDEPTERDIFVRPTSKVIKKPRVKKPMSEKQAAHMKKLQSLRENKKKLVAEQKEAQIQDAIERIAKQRLEQRAKVVPKAQAPVRQAPVRQAPVRQASKPKPTIDDNDDEFLEYLEFKKQKAKAKQAKTKPKAKITKPKGSYYLDFLTPKVSYGNYQNPYGM